MENLHDSNMSGFYLKASAAARNNVNNITNNCGGVSVGTKCGRWNATAEQVKVLTELFRAGLRTPSTDQIQKISSQLSFYGKIESKNVFYWFQNHKARERQKRRRVSVDDEDDVDEQHHVMLRKDEKLSSARLLKQERNQETEAEQRVIETLQLFPVNSFDLSQGTKTIEYEYETATAKCADKLGSYEFMEHPPLDLRLSFA